MIDYVLGLDMGSNSVGWTAVSTEGEVFENDLLVRSGVRIFPEGIDRRNPAKEKSRAQDRREARSQRRQHRRRSQRRRQLLEILQQYDMAPKEKDSVDDWLKTFPYPLRSRGVTEELSLQEFGRALFHLCQRRGYKSNRKQGKSKDDGKVAKATTELQSCIDEAEYKTLGQYLASKVDTQGDKQIHRTMESHRVRDQHTLRSMYENEFDILWETQSKYNSSLFTDTLKEKIHEAIFYQRPLFWDRGTIGKCELEEGEERCAKAHWVSQKFRILQEVNNLLVLCDKQERPLNDEERKIVIDELMAKSDRSFDQIRDKLGFLETQTFNLEVQGKRKELKGNCVEVSLINKKALKKWYRDADDKLREDIYSALADIEDEDELKQKASEQWGLSEEQITELLKISLPTGRMNISLKAMYKINPFLEQGMVFSKAKEMAGYDLRKTIERMPKLPPVDEAIEYLTNPLVHRALSETRKLANAIIRKYGPPQEIVIELARDMKNGSKKRKEIFFDNIKRRDENDEIRTKLRTEFNLHSPKRDDVIKYRLWKECNQTCVYTGRIIPQAKLFTGEVQIEHILPYSRTLDDSYMNKTLCFADENRTIKGNKTPWEAYHDTRPEQFEKILQNIKELPYPKRKKFTQKEIDTDGFLARQLNDTRYMSRLAVSYLSHVCNTVRCVKGGTTSELRHQWGLNSILNSESANIKTRDDHRHHAVDAAVVAMTTRGMLQKLSNTKYNQSKPELPLPWPRFRKDLIEAVNQINISHRPDSRKLSGKLHKDTYYGPGKGEGKAVLRKPIDAMNYGETDNIRDETVKKIVRNSVEACADQQGISLKNNDNLGKILKDTIIAMPSGVPIRKVRLERVEKTLKPLKKDASGRVIKLVKPGGNHHAEIFENSDCTWTGKAISRFEAHKIYREAIKHKDYKKGREVIINRNPDDGTKFIMSLCINDMVRIPKPIKRKSGKVIAMGLYHVKSISADDKRPDIEIMPHTVALWENKSDRIRLTNWNDFKSTEKVTVDLLGNIHPCND